MFMIIGLPHDNSMDVLLVALRLDGSAEHMRNAAAFRLREMPKHALHKGLSVDQGFYIRANGDLQGALRGR